MLDEHVNLAEKWIKTIFPYGRSLWESDEAKKPPLAQIDDALNIFFPSKVGYDNLIVIGRETFVCEDRIVNDPSLWSRIVYLSW